MTISKEERAAVRERCHDAVNYSRYERMRQLGRDGFSLLDALEAAERERDELQAKFEAIWPESQRELAAQPPPVKGGE